MAATQHRAGDPGHSITFEDGIDLVVRPISPADAAALSRFHSHLSARSVQQRYFYPHTDLSLDEVTHLTQVDGQDRVALVVERAGEIVAVGRYDRLDDPRVAEVAFVVADVYQHHGLATMLLFRLAHTARAVGITCFVAEVLAENRTMLSVFHDSGYQQHSTTEWGTVTLSMTLGAGVAPALH
jgi:RimJ/RimL family protein N-acetyltransferase